MVQLKYSGNGMRSLGIKFSPTTNDGLYTLEQEDSEYLLKTFPKQFTKIENIKDEKDDTPVKKKRIPITRSKSTDTPEG